MPRTTYNDKEKELVKLAQELGESLLDCHRKVSMMYQYVYPEGDKKNYRQDIYDDLNRSLRDASEYYHQLRQWLE